MAKSLMGNLIAAKKKILGKRGAKISPKLSKTLSNIKTNFSKRAAAE